MWIILLNILMHDYLHQIVPTSCSTEIVETSNDATTLMTSSGMEHRRDSISSSVVNAVASGTSIVKKRPRTSMASLHGATVAELNAALKAAAENDDADDDIFIDTKDLCNRIAYELKAHSIPQAIFAERVLCRCVFNPK